MPFRVPGRDRAGGMVFMPGTGAPAGCRGGLLAAIRAAGRRSYTGEFLNQYTRRLSDLGDRSEQGGRARHFFDRLRRIAVAI